MPDPSFMSPADILKVVRAQRDAWDSNKLENIYFKRYIDRDPEDSPEEWGPYTWQEGFHSSDAMQRMLMCANRSGKTRTCAAEVAIHATGKYPDWWKGRRFDAPVNVMVCGVDTKQTRDVAQLALLGEIVGEGAKREADGRGWIPKDCIQSITFSSQGHKNCADQAVIKHVSGDVSRISFKSYEQQLSTFQGTARDVVWFDEEPEGENAWEYYSESLTRMVDRNGIMIVSRTPLDGITELVDHFQKGHLESGGTIRYFQHGWDDCPHLDPKAKEALKGTYKPHEIECRTKGIPQLGSGAIYNYSSDEISVDDLFDIPWTWRRIAGLDIGIDHPTCVVWLAHNPVTNEIIVYDEYSKEGQGVLYHAAAIKQRGEWIPIAWPHDALQKDKGTAIDITEQYEEQGVNMLPISARYADDKGGGQATEPIISRINEMLKTGQIKISKRCIKLLAEMRQYHRKDGAIVREKDDCISAFHYAVMMLRYAEQNSRDFGQRAGRRVMGRASRIPNPFST